MLLLLSSLLQPFLFLVVFFHDDQIAHLIVFDDVDEPFLHTLLLLSLHGIEESKRTFTTTTLLESIILSPSLRDENDGRECQQSAQK